MAHLRAGLRRADRVEHAGGRELSSRNRSFSAGFNGAPPLTSIEQARGVVPARLELLDERSGERVADHLHRQHLLGLDRPPHLGGVEAAGLVGHDDGAAAGEAGERRPLGGAVHERRGGA